MRLTPRKVKEVMHVEKPFFSIVVPVYNVKDYLMECVGSVLRQDFSNYECILVDDGSTDGSGELCDEMVRRDERLRVYHQENRGLSAARNRGMQVAGGTYILFLDSDDFFAESNFLSMLAAGGRNADVVLFNYARFTDRLLPSILHFPQEPLLEEKDAFLLDLVSRNVYTSSAWNKAVRCDFLRKTGIQFEIGTLSEDIAWSAAIMLEARSWAVVPDCTYAYRVRNGSITRTISLAHVQMQLRIISKLVEEGTSLLGTMREAYFGYVSFQYCALLINIRMCRPSPDLVCLEKVRDMDWLLQYDTNRTVKLIHRVYRRLGFRATSWLLLIYFKLFCK